jgi:hypothetical protein
MALARLPEAGVLNCAYISIEESGAGKHVVTFAHGFGFVLLGLGRFARFLGLDTIFEPS